MIWNPFKVAPQSFLGVDIGTSSIKIVELSRWGQKKRLENYGEIRAEALYEKPFRSFEKSTLTVSSNDVVRAISAILSESKMKTKKSFFSIPDFSSFFTTFKLPPMTEEELPQAVQYEARQHIPLPLSEITLDWQIIERGKNGFKILLVAVPNEIIQQYQDIAVKAKLELLALEAEVFGLARALVKPSKPLPDPSKETESLILADIGTRSTTISIIDGGVLKVSHSFDTAGNNFTDVVSKGLSVDYKEAETLKQEWGINPDLPEVSTRQLLLALIDLISEEIKKISHNFYRAENKQIQKVILAGGSALLPGLADYFSKTLEKPVEIANPFTDIYHPLILENLLKEMGPSFTIAVGLAIRGLE